MTQSVSFLPWGRGLAALLLLGVLLGLVGCSGGKPVGSVTGKVTYKGNPVTSGSINFFAPDKGVAFDAPLGSAGEYTIAQIDAGTYKVYIQPPLPEQLPPGQVSKRPPFTVPKKYLDPISTTLSKDVKTGANEIPIDLPD